MRQMSCNIRIVASEWQTSFRVVPGKGLVIAVSEYDSLAEQVESDYKGIMLAFVTMDKRFHNTDQHLSNMQTNFSNMQTNFSNMQTHISNMQTHISNIQREIQNLDTGMRETQGEMREMRAVMRNASTSMDNLHGTVRKLFVQGRTTTDRIDDVARRVDQIEKKAPPAA